jgi:hypothetical protein
LLDDNFFSITGLIAQKFGCHQLLELRLRPFKQGVKGEINKDFFVSAKGKASPFDV